MKSEIKKTIMDMLSDAGVNSCDTTEDFTWLFNAVKDNAEQLRAYFQTAIYMIVVGTKKLKLLESEVENGKQ